MLYFGFWKRCGIDISSRFAIAILYYYQNDLLNIKRRLMFMMLLFHSWVKSHPRLGKRKLVDGPWPGKKP